MNVLSTSKAELLREAAQGYDVVVVVEWGKGEELVEFFPGFTAYFNQYSVTSPRTQRGAGRGEGICILVRGTLPSKLLEHTRQATWIQVGMGNSKVVIGGTYMHGEASRVWARETGGRQPAAEAREAAFEGLRDNILSYKSIGPLFLLGDFNARVGPLPDVDHAVQTILDSMGLASDEVVSSHIPLRRHTQDTVGTDSFGRMLIAQCCIEAGCLLLNGRAPGDEQGACTRENACLDYGLATVMGYPLVQSFRVLPLEPLSDHQPIECKIRLASEEERDQPDHPQPRPVPRWDPSKREAYVQSLMSGDNRTAICNIEDGLKNSTLDPLKAARQLSGVLHRAAVGAFGVERQGKEKLPSGRVPNNWFWHCKQEYQALREALRRGDSHAVKQLRREFRRVRRKWERYFDHRQQARMMDDLKHNPRKFWSAFKGRRCSMVKFDMPQLHGYWNALYGGNGRGDLGELGQDMDTLLQNLEAIASTSQSYETATQLNTSLKGGEVEKALKKLHSGRAPGPDGLRAEHLKGVYTEIDIDLDGKVIREYHLVPVLHKLYDALFRNGQYVREWSRASLTAVFKKGDATSLDNYRAIAVGAVFGKLYSVLLDRRLSSLAERDGWRAEGQAGFRPEKSTMDHVFVLRHLIEVAQGDSRNQPLFCCFVDFRKAYDKVRRDLLVQRLAELGVHGNMLQAIVQMYWEAPLVPKIGTALGPEIASKCGVKQGDPLSPLLFGLFIDEFETWLKERLPGVGVRLGTRVLQMLLYADDMVLFAHDPASLQRQLNLLHEFCVAKGMEVNVNKTETVVFRHPRSPMQQTCWSWHYHGFPIQRVSEFKYLGVVMHETRGLSVAIASLAAAARRAAWSMISRFRVGKIKDISLKLRMFKSLVLPIMEYCGAVWCPDLLAPCQHLYQMFDNPLQQVQTAFLRGLGQLRKSISTTVLHKEMCLDPVAKGWLRASLDLWGRLQTAPANSILGIAVRESIRIARSSPQGRQGSWVGRYMRTLSNIALNGQRDPDQALQSFVSTWGFNAENNALLAVPRGVVWDAWDKMLGEPWQDLDADPRTAPSTKVRMVTYNSWFAVETPPQIEKKLKHDYPEGMPRYIRHTGGIPFEQVKQLMRLRTGAHHLRVETGRWQNPRLPRADRVCQKCTWGTKVEDEFHILFECPRYHHIRVRYEQSLFTAFGGISQTPRSMIIQGKMSAFMNQDPKQVAAFVWECMQYRQYD